MTLPSRIPLGQTEGVFREAFSDLEYLRKEICYNRRTINVISAFYNNSDKTVCLLYTHNYPDTTITKEDNPNFDSEGIPPHTHRLAYSYLSRKQVFRRNYIVQIYVLDWDKTRSKLPFEERFSYLRRYELTREWLEEHDWTVTYP